MVEEQPSRFLRRASIRSRYKHRVLRKFIHNNKDRFEVTNLWKFDDEIHGNSFPRFFLELGGVVATLQPFFSQSCPSEKPNMISHKSAHSHLYSTNNRIWLAMPESFLHQDGLPTSHHESPTIIPFSSHLQRHTIFLFLPQGGLPLANTSLLYPF